MKIEIPYKFPSFNEYVNKCRANRYGGGSVKHQVEDDIIWYLKELPKFQKPIKLNFTWVEINKKRDFDNICYAKKFILDALQKAGKLKNDNRKWVVGFEDNFEIGNEYKVVLDIEEVEDEKIY